MKQEPNTTRDVLRTYKELRDLPSLEQWRKAVPSDVRRQWVRHMLHSALFKKASSDVRFSRLIIDHADKETKETLIELTEAIQQLTEQDVEIVDPEMKEQNGFSAGLKEMQLKHELQSIPITDEMVDAFARMHFLSFSKNKQVRENFFEKRRKRVRLVIDGVRQLAQRPDKFEELLTRFPMSIERATAQVAIRNYKSSANGQSPLLNAAVLFGSAAIGPRSEDYPGEQDLDVLFLPSLHNPNATSTTRNRLSYLSALIRYTSTLLGSVGEERDTGKTAEYQKHAGIIGEYAPALARILDTPNLMTRMRNPHLLFPTDAYKTTDNASDWFILAGPHEVFPMNTPAATKRSYHTYLERSIRTARAVAKAEASSR